MKINFKKIFIVSSIFILSSYITSFANTWKNEGNSWKYYDKNGNLMKAWIQDKGVWYYLDPINGNLKSGWLKSGDKWYFLNPQKGTDEGKLLTGWQWIDGYCYYFDIKSGNMYSNQLTPDGYMTNPNGRWIDKNNKEIFIHNKGFNTNIKKAENLLVRNANKLFKGSGGSGGGSSRSSSYTSYINKNQASDKQANKNTGDIINNTPAENNIDEANNKPIENNNNTNNSKPDENSINANNNKEQLNKDRPATPSIALNKGNTDNTNPNANIEDKQELEAVKAEHVKQNLQELGNKNIAQFVDENGKINTIAWVKNITAPIMGENGDFKKEVLIENGKTYISYNAPFVSGNSWFDINKASSGSASQIDRNLCFCATASNMLSWWLEQNKEYIDKYIQEKGNISKKIGSKDYDLYSLQTPPDNQEDSKVFELFKHIFANRSKGFYTDLLFDLFINGYTPKENGVINVEDTNLIPDARGGFFYDIFKETILSERRSNSKYKDLNDDLKELIGKDSIVAISFNFGNYSHVITIWGAEYNSDNQLSAIYVTDSDDQTVLLDNNSDTKVAMKRYSIKNVNGKPKLGGAINDNNSGSNIGCTYILSLGTDSWEKYFTK